MVLVALAWRRKILSAKRRYGRNCVGSSFSSRINSSRLARHVTRTLSLSNVSLSAGSNSTICFDQLAKDPGGYTWSTYKGPGYLFKKGNPNQGLPFYASRLTYERYMICNNKGRNLGLT